MLDFSLTTSFPALISVLAFPADFWALGSVWIARGAAFGLGIPVALGAEAFVFGEATFK